jgi:hypothetical protein
MGTKRHHSAAICLGTQTTAITGHSLASLSRTNKKSAFMLIAPPGPFIIMSNDNSGRIALTVPDAGLCFSVTAEIHCEPCNCGIAHH